MRKKLHSKLFIFFSLLCMYIMLKILTILSYNETTSANSVGVNKIFVLSPITNCSETAFLGKPPSVRKHSCDYCDQITCERLLYNKTANVYKIAYKFMANHLYIPNNNMQMISMTANCDEFKRLNGYVLKPLSDLEANFPLAYNILMHRDVSQIEKLLRALYAPQNVYCIHIDKRASREVHEAMESLTKCFPNVYIASKLEQVVYAGISRLQADINCMRDHLNSPVKWKYLMNTAGQAFPLKTNREIVQILSLYNGSNDIEGLYGRKYLNFRFVKEWKEVGLDTNNPRLEETGKPHVKPPHNLDIIKGSAYGIFSRDFVHYLINDPVAKDFYEWCKLTWSPDEQFWATLQHTYSNPHIKPPGSYAGKYPHGYETLFLNLCLVLIVLLWKYVIKSM